MVESYQKVQNYFEKNRFLLFPNFRENREFLLIFISTTAFGLMGFLYFLFNGLEVYDAPAHISLIQHLRDYLWPNFVGWNSFSLLGFEQGITYPPLFHYLAATLGLVLGVELATKVLIYLSLLALPASIFYFAAALTQDKDKRLLVTGLLTFLILVVPGYLGANLKALTQVGLLPSVVSLPLVFLYFGSVGFLVKGKILLPTILASLIILSHLVAGLIIVGFMICRFLINFLEKKPAGTFTTHLVLTALFTAFFWLPFLLNYENLSSSAHPSSLGWPNLLSLFLSGSFLIAFLKKGSGMEKSLSLFVVGLSTLTLLDSLIQDFTANFLFEKLYSLHLYRFQIYQYLILGSLLAIFLTDFLRKVKLLQLINFFIFVPLLLAVVFLAVKSPFVTKITLDMVEVEATGRFLETFRRTEVFPLTYSLQSKLVANEKIPWAYGLFTDATPNGPYLGSLIKSLRPEAYTQGLDSALIENKLVEPKMAADALDLFGVEYLLNLGEGEPSLNKEMVAQASIGDQRKNFFLEKRADQNLVEIPKTSIRVVEDNWEQEVERWWLGSEEMKEILVFDRQGSLSSVKEGRAGQVHLLGNKEDWTEFAINIDSQGEVPVLIKFGYSPNWKAFKAGSEIKIYQASPSLMLVVGNGEISFKYMKPWLPSVLLLVSIISLLSSIYLVKRGLM